MKNLIQQIETLITENEAIKINCMKAVQVRESEVARTAYASAKAENNAYLKVLNLIKDSHNIVTKQPK